MAAPVLNIVPQTFTGQASADTIETLEQWLGKAKNGEIVSVALVGLKPCGGTLTAITKCPHVQAILGGMTILQMRVARAVDDLG